MMVGGTLCLLFLLSCLLSCAPWCRALAPSSGFEILQGAAAIPVLVPCDIGDQNFLLAFKRALTNGDAKLAKWSNDSSCCAWPGVGCSDNSTGMQAQGGLASDSIVSSEYQRVRHLWLSGMELSGNVDYLAWADLSSLQTLDLSSNCLTGPLPGTLDQIVTLQSLSVSRNNFSGDLEVLTRCPSLLEVDVSYNNLSGHVPTMFNSPNLRTLNISGNTFSGPWEGLDSMGDLQVVNASRNSITGMLPHFPNCSALLELDLAENLFAGGLDTAVCVMNPILQLLNVSSNSLNGNLSSDISHCSALEVLDISFNKFGGPIPPDLLHLGALKCLSLSNNQFVEMLGPVGSLTNMRRLLLSNNNLTGVIPTDMGLLKNLERLDLSFNAFRGDIPFELSNCGQLNALILRRNMLTGNISLAFDRLPNLTTLDLSYNFLSGEIPSTVSLCSRLQSLTLSNNTITGKIPRELGSLKYLVTLSLSSNNLTGGIPPELDGCTSLVSLLLTKNPYLGGDIPGNMSAFPNLQLLAMGVCNLQGRIPDWIGATFKLQLLDLSWNKFHGPLPGWISTLQHLIYLDLSNNTLSGFLPVNLSTSPSYSGQEVDASSLVEVTTLVLFVLRNASAMPQRYTRLSSFPPSLLLGSNQFYGSIPPEYGNLQRVMALDLSHNRLIGHIPSTLSNMSSLYSLNLADNLLSGSIPPSFSNLNFLALFNVSNNNLSGPIPDGTQFSSFSELSFLNNPLLCGPPLNKCSLVPTVDPQEALLPPGAEHKGFSKKAILGLSIGVGLGMAMVLALLTKCILSRRQEKPLPDDDEEMESTDGMVSFSVDLYLNDQLAKLSPADLVKATNNFDQSNIIGCGGFGLVFRATFSDGTHVAIKRLSGDTGQAEKEVQAEVVTLGQIQHRNLVALQGYCRFGSDRLLIYNYMENGSLDYWLHERTDGGLKLDWPMRRRIAQGTARGLSYLHQMCEPHIVHRDIKTSNILLNEKFEAHLSDFGLARHLANTDTHVSTELVGTLGYIPPEYGQAWIATLRGDVYSFGVVVLELLTRRRPVEVTRKKGVADLVSWVQEMRNKGTPEEVFDVLLRHQGYEDEMLHVLDVATMCVNHNPQKRPTIQEVVTLLEQVGMDPADKETKDSGDLFV